MVRLILVCVILALGIGGAYWLSRNSGDLVFTFMNFKVETSVTEFFAYAILAFFILQILVFGVYRLVSLPSKLRQHLRNKKKDAVIKSIGDAINNYVAKESKKLSNNIAFVKQYLSSETQLSLGYLLSKTQNDKSECKNKLVLLTRNEASKEVAFKELIKIALEEREWFIAANYCAELWKICKSKELAVQYVSCYINSKRWRELAEILEPSSFIQSLFSRDISYYLGKKNSVVMKAVAEYKIAQELLECGEKAKAKIYALKALKHLDDGFLPATIVVISSLNYSEDQEQILKIIKKQWRNKPSHLLAEILFDLTKINVGLKLYKMIKKVAGMNAEHYESNIILARAAMDSDMFDLASQHIASALSDGKKLRACLLMAEFCQRTHANKAEVADWLRQALIAPNDKEPVEYYWDFVKSDWVHNSSEDSVFIEALKS